MPMISVVNGDPQYPISARPVFVRTVPQTWEYKTIYVAENLDPAQALAKEGMETVPPETIAAVDLGQEEVSVIERVQDLAGPR